MNEAGHTSVIIIDDHPLFRKGVADLIGMEPALRLVGEAADGESGIRLACSVDPDLILPDLNMKGLNGIETLRRLRAADLEARIIMLTVSENEDDSEQEAATGRGGPATRHHR